MHDCSGLVVPLSHKFSYPDVSLEHKIRYLSHCLYTDVMISLRDVAEIKRIPALHNTSLSLCIGNHELYIAEYLFEKHCSKIFIGIDNMKDLKDFEQRMDELTIIYGTSSFAANIHVTNDESFSTIYEYLLGRPNYFSELSVINDQNRTQIVNNSTLDALNNLKKLLGIEINIVCELNANSWNKLKKLNFNTVNQFQVFTKWDNI